MAPSISSKEKAKARDGKEKTSPPPSPAIFRIPHFWGILLRIAIWILWPDIPSRLDERVEVTTPITSFKSLMEGVYLFKNGIPVYEGGSFHQAPLVLLLFSTLPAFLGPVLFIVADYIVAYCLVQLAQYKLDHTIDVSWKDATLIPENDKDHHDEEDKDHNDEKDNMVGDLDEAEDQAYNAKISSKDKDPTKPIDIPIVPSDIGSMYLLNPLSIMTCLAQNTQLFSTVSMALGLLYASKGNRRASMLALAFGTYLTLYPFLLVAPCILFLNMKNNEKLQGHADKGERPKIESLQTTILKSLGGLVCYTLGLIYLSHLLMGDWTFLSSTYGAIIFVYDLQPTVGLYWYFFMEVFDQFRTFFLTVFHLNVFVFTIPICIKFRNQPLLASVVVCASISLFKSYPSIADITFYLSLISMHFELFKYAPHMYLALSGLLYCSLLGPLFFNAWVYVAGGNANFFYAITLVWGVSQIMLVVDLVFAHLKREWEKTKPGWRRMRVELLYQYNE